LVEAKNFVPSIWAPGTEGASGATGYARIATILRGRFLFWENESEKGREVMRKG
jgi:hypothetical protein